MICYSAIYLGIQTFSTHVIYFFYFVFIKLE